MTPSIAAFNKHIAMPSFEMAVDKGWWTVLDNDPERPTWPIVYIAIKAYPKTGAPDQYVLRFDLQGYSSIAPTAVPWDLTKDAILEKHLWPKGNAFVTSTFTPELGYLYAPCDRNANPAGHHEWPPLHPDSLWNAQSTIYTYLNFVRRLLNSQDYANS